jgi:hypothetical protein
MPPHRRVYAKVSDLKRVDMTIRDYHKATAHISQDSTLSDFKQSLRRRLYSSEIDTSINKEEEE